MLKFTVDGQKLELLGDPHVVADTFDYLTGSFKFYSGHDWDLTEKHVFFQLGEATPYEVTLTDDEFVKTDHVNLTTGVWSIYVIGYDIDGATLVERITTNKVSLTAQISGVPEGEPFPPSIIHDVLIVKDQTTPQTFINGVPKLTADRVIDLDNELADKKYVDDAVAGVTADDFAHNSLSSLQGGGATERYHMTQAENAALHAHSNKTALDAVAGVNTGDQAASSFNHNDLANKQGGTTDQYYHVTSAEKTVIQNTSGTNTGDQDVSGAISTHNTDAGAHAGLFEAVNAQVINVTQYPSNRFVRALGHGLSVGKFPTNLLIIGDSTGNDENEWVYLTAQWIASRYPALSVLYRNWVDSMQYYNGSRIIQTGVSGLAHVYLNGVPGTRLRTVDKASLDITGDLEIIAKISANDYTNGARQTIVNKFSSSGQYSYSLGINGTGYPYLWFSSDGTSTVTRTSTAAIPSADGSDLWIKATLDVNNGSSENSVKFYTSGNGVTWAQLGTTITTPGVTSIFLSTSEMEIGSRAGSDMFAGKIYSVIVKNGIDGAPVVDFDASMRFPLSSSYTDLIGNIWIMGGAASISGSVGVTIFNASTAGQDVAYSIDATRFALQAIAEPQLTFINYGHNDTATGYQAIYEGLCIQILTRWPNSGVVCIAQNPQVSPRTEAQITTHARITSEIVKACSKNNYGFIDVYRAMLESGEISDLINASDGVHLTADGSIFWCNEVKKFLQSAI